MISNLSIVDFGRHQLLYLRYCCMYYTQLFFLNLELVFLFLRLRKSLLELFQKLEYLDQELLIIRFAEKAS